MFIWVFRRFTISHLAQLKIVLPEVIEITKVLVKDEGTSDMKPDLCVTMNVDAVENDDKLKSEGGGHMHLRRAFRHRLGDISKSHPEVYCIHLLIFGGTQLTWFDYFIFNVI